jgi:hypothetical protein
MLPARPLLWADGCNLDLNYADSDTISFLLDTNDPEDASSYRKLVQWLSWQGSVRRDQCLAGDAATEFWNSLPVDQN